MKTIGKEDSLSQAFGFRDGILAVVGAGGKTTSVYKIAGEQAAQGKSVLVTTTTHMELPEQDAVLSGNTDDIRQNIKPGKTVTAGIRDGKKMKGLPKEVFQAVSSFADITIVEADGSKRRPIKARNDTEPVIPEGTGQILITAGMSALGRPVKEVCHRPELVCKLLEKSCEDFIKFEDIIQLIETGYVIMLRQQYPEADLFILLNQCDTKELMEQAARIGRYFDCRYPVILR